MLNQVTADAGAHKRRKRVGRGEGSGHGRQSGRGNKGCQARAGGGTRPLHEGGQMPIFRRLPKRGFSNFEFRTEYQVVNLGDLDRIFEDGATVDRVTLRAHGYAQHNQPIKVLGTGTLSKKLNLRVDAVSASAREAIEKSGGTLQIIEKLDRSAAAKAKRNSRKNGAKRAVEGKAQQRPAKPGKAESAKATKPDSRKPSQSDEVE